MIQQDEPPITGRPNGPAGIRGRVWRWCRRHPWVAVPGLLIGTLIASQVAYETWLLHGWRPDIVARGQIVDYDTRRPVAGVWVLIDIEAFARTFDSQGRLIWYIPEGGGNGMTSPLSSVVQTDQDGRFYYRVSAYDAFQSAGYTKYLLEYGAYKDGYETVNPDTGKSSKGGQNYLTLEKPKPDQPWAFVRRVADTAEGRRTSRDDFPQGVESYASASTWPQWSRFYHRVVSDELDHWCRAQTPAQEDRLYASFDTAKSLIRQHAILRLLGRLGEDRSLWDSAHDRLGDIFRDYEKDFRLAAMDFAWSAVTEMSVTGQRPQGPDFTLAEKVALCKVMRNQIDRLSQL